MWVLLLLSPAIAADPFERWPGQTRTNGLGATLGIATGDADADGWTDILVPLGGAIWRNEAGVDWTYIPFPEIADIHRSQYGAAFGDYNADGLPDIATEPRNEYAELFHNLGGFAFTPLDRDQFPRAPHKQYAETNGWVDADGDGWLDLFIPAYFGDSGFYANLGPDGKGEYRFDEIALEIGITLGTTAELRPEGAQFHDVDRDGDADLYVCGELLRNDSRPGDFWFEHQPDSGIVYAFDEGAVFADIDVDGDMDLGVLYHAVTWDDSLPIMAMVLWENLGDATFVQMAADRLEDIDITETYNLGLSFADWDNDGDPDLTFSDRFEQNQRMESGEVRFERIETEAAQTCALPGWFDWDVDGDLDIALGVWGLEGQFFTNTRYDETAVGARQYLRVHPVNDSETLPDGVDDAFGATVEVHVSGEAPEIRRRDFTASGHGYLNQEEYTVAFGLEGLDEPIVDVAVDFVNPADEGVWRIDRHVNPALGDLDVLSLSDREVRVFRSGKVVVDGVEHLPSEAESPLLETPGGIWTPTIEDSLTPTPPNTWVGLELNVPRDDDAERGAVLREVVVDGTLGPPETCGDLRGNILLWDVTDGSPALVGAAEGAVLRNNRRVDVPTDFTLEPGHHYRVMARADAIRTFLPADSTSWVQVGAFVEGAPEGSACDAGFVSELEGAIGPRAMTIRWRETRIAPQDSGPNVLVLDGCGCSTGSGATPLSVLIGIGAMVRLRMRKSRTGL